MVPPSSPTPNVYLGRTFCATIAVLMMGLLVLWAATAGGQSFTTETLRRQQVSAMPQRIAAFDVITASGEKTSLNALLAAGNKVWLVDFVYTRCQTVCSALGGIYQQLQAQIEAEGLQAQVGLLSISFDPANDDAAALKTYSERLRINPAVWQVATLSRWQDRRRLLNAFGIMVLPAPLGEFEHNAALHVVTSDGRLISIIDYGDYKSALQAAMAAAVATRKSGATPQALQALLGSQALQ